MWPLVQSLPELVHHAPTVVDMLLALLEDPVVVIQVRLFYDGTSGCLVKPNRVFDTLLFFF